PVKAFAIDDGITFTLGALVNNAAGVTVGLGVLARAQHLHAGTDGGHDRTAGQRVDVVHDDAIKGAAVRNLGVGRQGFVGRLPLVLEQGRVRFLPVVQGGLQTTTTPDTHRVVDGVRNGLGQIRVNRVETGFQGVDQRNVQTVSPDARRDR